MKGSRPLTTEEILSLLTAMDAHRYPARDKALLLLGVRSGFRVSELLSLRVKDVFQNGRIPDQVAVSRANMKGKHEGRTVPLHREAKVAIELWLTEFFRICPSDPQAPLFPSRAPGSRAMNRRRAWEMLTRVYRKLGLTGKLGTHCMRKAFAKRIYEYLGNDLLALQEALGHKRITSTTNYVAFAREKVDAAILKD